MSLLEVIKSLVRRVKCFLMVLRRDPSFIAFLRGLTLALQALLDDVVQLFLSFDRLEAFLDFF